jgi:tRNA-uridine 2-sulfurtransferase
MSTVTPQKKVYVGMSGGVDSSVSAALLQKAGYDVTGVFIKVWHPDFLPCDWRKDRLDAMRVCAQLGIPFKTLDLGAEYKRDVVDYMIREYREGRTPNPDVMCNRYIKFGAFWQWAKSQGANYIATGHYAHTEDGRLFVSPDESKDQTYFLWTLTADDLLHTIFPIGKYHKKEVRALAEKFALPTAAKKDSQGLCFVGKVDMKEFLQHFITTQPGDVLDEEGHVIGRHDGALLYTIGERHGFTVTTQTDNAAPKYVVKKDLAANTITVASQKTNETGSVAAAREALLEQVNWIRQPRTDEKIDARVRYHQALQSCAITHDNHAAKVAFSIPQTLAIGQSIVFYTADECLGGGVIAAVTV